MNFTIIIFGFLFAAGREISEHAKESKFKDWGKWWNTNQSWTNKHRWYPSWFWKTAGVWLTDAEHFFQMLSLISVLFAVLIPAFGFEAALWFYAGNVLAGFLKIFTNIS